MNDLSEKNLVNDKSNSQQIDLLSIDIKDENTALNILVGYLGLAQRRGAFAINESSKIYDAIKMFKGAPSSQ
tara:strand:+ start:100 stop:315 length:216 start_codon:yes stop_codon:yes gene_type:complete